MKALMQQTIQRTKDSVTIPLTFIGILWCIHLLNSLIFSGSLNRFGVIPRTLEGLTGIFFAPLLHGSYDHIIGNSFMLFLLSWIICFYDKNTWFKSVIYGTLVGGFITWLIGTGGVHIGASILVFSLWGTILGISIFHKKPFFIIASLILMATYGVSMFYGLIPQQGISFAGHLGGLIAGFLCAKGLTK